MSAVWVKLLQAAPNSSRFAKLGIGKVLVESKISSRKLNVADLRKILITDVAFRNRLVGVDSSELQVYKNEADAGDPGKAIKLSEELSELIEENGYDNPLIVVTPPKPATFIQQTSVPYNHIEKELKIIFQGLNHHFTRPVDPKDVEASQRSRLGPFYKRTLPHHKTATDISLVMLGLALDKQASTNYGKTLCEIVEDDIGVYYGEHVVAMVAPSGSGKTATIIDLANKHFVIYCVCCISSPTISPGFKDPNFITLAEDVEDIYWTIVNRNQGSWYGPQDIDSEVKSRVVERVKLEFLARMLFLQYLLENNPDLKPQQFFHEQITAGNLTIGELVSKLRKYDNYTIQAMLNKVQTKLQFHLSSKKIGMVIALDEAQVAVTDILSGKLISPAAFTYNRNNLFDDKNQIQPRFRRSFFTLLSGALSIMQATQVILGTAVSLQNVDSVHSNIAKQTNFLRIKNFPSFDEGDVSRLYSDLIDMSGCEIPPAKLRMLTGRPQFSIDVINRLAASCTFQDSKQATLEHAIDKSIEYTMSGLRTEIRIILDNDQTGETTRLLSRMAMAYHLHGGKVSFLSKGQFDFVDKALCKLRLHYGNIHLVMDEPIVVETVQEELKASDKNPVFLEHLNQIFKRDALGHLFVNHFNASMATVLLSSFSSRRHIAAWCNNFQLQIDEINTANGFGYTTVVSVQISLPHECLRIMLIVNNGTCPDGVWFFSDKRYAGSLAIKLRSDRLKQSTHESNETSSNIRSCFLKQSRANVIQSLADIRHDFEASGTSSNLRASSASISNSLASRRPFKPGRFFFEGIAENKDDMVKLKKLIKFVSISE
ncbi:hypothetical protein BDF19DRAFT_417138 [Syncephalis fuscata]|nr:hypothetical protein BDF19DRAFT_417138 [Syncephalis fuscata]